MKLKDVLSKVIKNKNNGQLVTCLKKNKLKKVGLSKDELLEMKLDTKLKMLLLED
jgi:hypothetical protein